MNKTILMGRLTKDMDISFSKTTGNAFGNTTIAVNRSYTNKEGQTEADFINIKAFGKIAETIANHVKKGQRILIEGTIQTGYFEKDGKRIYTTDVIVQAFQFVELKNKD